MHNDSSRIIRLPVALSRFPVDMCKYRQISYTCGHKATFRLSACRGTYSKVTRLKHASAFSKPSSADLAKQARIRADLQACGKLEELEYKREAQCKAAKADEILDVHSVQECGSCQYERFREEWKQRLGHAEERFNAADSQEEEEVLKDSFHRLQHEADTADWVARGMFPIGRKSSNRSRGERISGSVRAASRLRVEVFREDVEECSESLRAWSFKSSIWD
jgi:hypothetical protein